MPSRSFIVLVFFLVYSTLTAQYKVEKHRAGAYSYETVTNDILGVRKYVLANGLTIFTNVQQDEPRIQTLISVRAGSKNDPADATGLAHYLEHMLFKGTDRYGTLNFEKESALIGKIEETFERYRVTSDATQRTALYHVIDSLSGLAATYAIPGEYDRMVKRMGARGTNAHTSVEETVYENDIPRNQLKRWLTLEAERFRHPVLRLFHTELEAVYEEKNRTLDNDGRQVNETMLAALFQRHQYGTQTTIGTVDHLKNPSMKKIREFYTKNYVPNNMAFILVGDFDPDQAVSMIDSLFGGFKAQPMTEFIVENEEPITSPVVREVFGPSAESVTMAFRFAGATSRDVVLMGMCDMLLSNRSTGLMDLNLAQKQKVLNPTASPQIMKDYSIHRFSAAPRKGQKLEEVTQLILEQIEELKKGSFGEQTMKAVVNDLRISHLKQLESTVNRASLLSQSFIQGQEWSNVLGYIDELARLTKTEVVEYAKKNYLNNYVVVYKRTGDNKNLQKVTKPAITPVAVNRDAQSEFSKKISEMPVEKISPRFSDFTNDIQHSTLNNGTEVLSVKNKENELYNLNFVWDYGTRHNKLFSVAMQYLDYVGAGALSSADVQTKLYELGCTIRVSASSDAMSVELSGLSENLNEALKIVNEKFVNPTSDSASLKLLVDGLLKQRVNIKKNKSVILQQAMMNYAVHGKRNPFTNVLSDQELKLLKVSDVLDLIRKLQQIKHKVEYYGPHEPKALCAILNAHHTMPSSLQNLAEPEPYVFQDNTEGVVYFLDYDMVQAEVLMRAKADVGYNVKNSPFVRLYNEYNGGMSGVVMQTIRESKALAYSVEAGFMAPRRQLEPYYLQAYIGTQADKLPEALVAMHEVLAQMPKNEGAWNNSKQSALEKIEAERFNKMALLQQYDNLQRLGLDYDVRSTIYEKIPGLSLDDIQKMRDEKLNGKKYTLAVLGSKAKIKFDDLKKYGELRELTLEDVFGY